MNSHLRTSAVFSANILLHFSLGLFGPEAVLDVFVGWPHWFVPISQVSKIWNLATIWGISAPRGQNLERPDYTDCLKT